MDVSTISTIFTTVKTATDIAKLLRESGLTLEKAETKLKLAELIEALADLKMQLADVRELLLEKDEEIKKLQGSLNLKESLIFEIPYYWLQGKNGKEGPYCQVCYDKDGKAVRLQGDGSGYWQCQVCNNSYTDSKYNPNGTIKTDYNPFD